MEALKAKARRGSGDLAPRLTDNRQVEAGDACAGTPGSEPVAGDGGCAEGAEGARVSAERPDAPTTHAQQEPRRPHASPAA